MELIPNLLKNFCQLEFGHFKGKRGRGANPNPNFLRNLCLLEIRPEGGLKAAWTMTKVKLLFPAGLP